MNIVQAARGARRPLRVGSIDLNEFDVIDAHVHRFEAAPFSELNGRWNGSFVDALMPAGDFNGRAAIPPTTLRAADDRSSICRE
jgi:hypothetical protein